MKLKFYNPDTAPARTDKRLGKPMVRLGKNGTFAFNQPAALALGLVVSSTIHVTQDEENPKDWYMVVDTAEKKGFPVRATKMLKSGPGMFIFNSSATGNALLASLGIAEGKAGFLIAAEPTAMSGDGINFFAIITSARKP